MQPLAEIESRLIRAEKHICDLSAELRAFSLSDPFEVRFYRDPQTRQPIYELTAIDKIPVNIQLISGDAISNMRSALDYLAYCLAKDRYSLDKVRFPIEGCSDNYRAVVQGVIKGVRDEPLEAICQIEPYKGGSGHILWVLNKLNNFHKHRLLVTVYSNLVGHSIPPAMRKRIESEWKGHGPAIPEGWSFMKVERPAGEPFRPLQVGDKLFADLPGTEIYDQMKFRFNVVFGESGVSEGDPLFETVNEMLTSVRGVVKELKPFV